jgi:hypothetical protein
VSEEINTPFRATPLPVAVADHVPDFDITPVDGEPKAGLGNVIVARTASAAVLISNVPALNNAPNADANSFRVAVFFTNAIVLLFYIFLNWFKP